MAYSFLEMWSPFYDPLYRWGGGSIMTWALLSFFRCCTFLWWLVLMRPHRLVNLLPRTVGVSPLQEPPPPTYYPISLCHVVFSYKVFRSFFCGRVAEVAVNECLGLSPRGVPPTLCRLVPFRTCDSPPRIVCWFRCELSVTYPKAQKFG